MNPKVVADGRATTVVVDGSRVHQTIDGFGISGAFGAANLIRELGDTPVRRRALDMLFSPTAGAGFSILRNLIPSDVAHTIAPEPSTAPAYVWDRDDWGQLWLTRQAMSYGVRTIYACAWSAPGFMKTNGDEANGGMLRSDRRRAYADYLVQYLRFYRQAGIDVSYLGFVNEPNWTTHYSSMLVDPAQAVDFVKVLGPALRASGLATRIACCDTLGWDLLADYTRAVLADSAASSAVSLFTSHGYSSAPDSAVDTGGKPVWQSEWSHGEGAWNPAWDDGSEQSGFSWAENIHNGLTMARLNAFLYWWGIWHNPNSNSGLIRLDGTNVLPAKRYYTFVNYSRFIRPGAVRAGASVGESDLRVSAFKNTDGSVVVVALNAATSAIASTCALRDVGVATGTALPYLTNGSNNTAPQPPLAVSGGTFTGIVPPRSLITYRITPRLRSS
ncbi:glycoside hydrolase family 30 protein [Allorhizocola rhizosphaerae]|uniref:glycoside hydrolase family 30 protein n=1 Tax=Allorhizocola rhizosphaerae TaxID=1872709 RepID=UPI0013C31CA5|nr:glycoside hydrolase [Allorhizocola rhizosphaerae]